MFVNRFIITEQSEVQHFDLFINNPTGNEDLRLVSVDLNYTHV